MIALRVTVPVACWRRGWAREYLETEPLPPPATCYGFLLSLVGEEDRSRHVGARVSASLLNQPARSVVLRTLWRVKDNKQPPGVGNNARPDYQQLLLGSELLIWCDSAEEHHAGPSLEARVQAALADPSSVERFGGLCLGESTHLVNDVGAWTAPALPATARSFVLDGVGPLTLPVWVDHVGSAGTRHVTGRLRAGPQPPTPEELPRVEPPQR